MLYDAVNSHIEKFKTGFFTSLPATVISFNAEESTIVAKPVMQDAFMDGDIIELPQIYDVPVIFPSAGGGSLTFPIQVGDEVLLVFSSRGFDTWWDTGNANVLPLTQRYNAYNDAVAIVGLTSKKNSVKASTENVELKFKDNLIRLLPNGTVEVETTSTISVSNPQEELISLLSDIVAEMAAITTQTIYGITPINNKAAVLALKARLDTFKK